MGHKSKLELLKNGYKLDHGGIIYPYIAKPTWNQVFRLEAELDEDVDVQSVVKALTNLKEKFPSFFVVMCKMRTFYLLKKTDELPEIVPEKGLCKMFNLEVNDHPLFRITYKGKTLGMEMFHSVADGNGAIVFFVNLLAEYYIVRGIDIPKDNKVFKHGMKYEKNDTENSFLKVFEQGGKTSSRSEEPAYQYNGGKSDCDIFLTSFLIPCDKFKAKAKEYDASVTEFLTAIYTKALCQCALEENSKNNVKVEIPLDLRRRFGSGTLRNFSLYFITSVPVNYAHEDIYKIVEVLKPQFKAGADTTKLRNDVYTNVNQSELAVFKMMPNGLKKAILKFGNSIYGERLFTTPLSNVGVMKLPDELEKHVKGLGFTIGRTLKNTVYTAIITYKGTINWSLTSVVQDKSIQKKITSILRELDIDFKKKER